jgi:hypothetical protein
MKEVIIGLLLTSIFYVYFQKQRFIELNKNDELTTVNIYKIDKN